MARIAWAARACAGVRPKLGAEPADLDDAEDLKAFFAVVQGLNGDDKLLAYHDRSDGGLLPPWRKWPLPAHAGVDVSLDVLADNEQGLAAALFSEELGAVLQVRREDVEEILMQFEAAGLATAPP